MIPRHPALAVELRNEADDLRRYARELDASGDAEGAAAVRNQSMHVDEWVDAVVELEADSAELRELLELVKGANTPGKLASHIADLESATDGLDEVKREVEELRASLKERNSELDDATRKRDELESRVEELREVVTRELRADAVERIAELERQVEELERRPASVDYNALRTSPKGSDARDCYLRAQALNEALDFLPVPARTVETIRRAIDGTIEHADRLDALREIARAMTAEAGKASADPSDYLRASLVDLLDALEAVDREDDDAYPRLEAAIRRGRSATGTERPEAPAVVDPQGAAREALRLAIAQREEARAALATMNADHPLQLAYEAELEAELRRVKPKGKVPRLDNGRLDVVAASGKLPDGGHAIRDRYAGEVRKIRDELDAAYTAAVDAVVAAALDVTPRTTDGARTLLAEAWTSTYSTQTSPEIYARGMIAIEAKTAYANCPGILLEHEDVATSGKLAGVRLYGNVEPLDAEAIRIKGLELPERVRLAYASGCNPRVYWPTLPHGYEERHGLDRFGGRTVTP